MKQYEFALAEYEKLTKPPAPPAQPAFVMPVPVVAVAKRNLPITLDYSARVEAIANVTLQAKVTGYLVEQLSPDGTDVKEGDLLYRIDPRDYDAMLELAKAQLARDTANLDYLKSNLDRGTDLAKSGYVSKDAFDQRTSAVKQAESALAIDRASIRTAELNRGYTEIRAPFAGRLGRSVASVGTLVGSGGTVLNTLVKIDPVYVTFDPSETELSKIVAARASGEVAAEVTVPGTTDAPRQGSLTFIDNGVDKATGTIVARATIPNADKALVPGEYVHVKLSIGVEPDALMVPQTALGSSQFGKYLYVVGKGNKVEMRQVTVGRNDGELVSILSGIKQNDQVINGNLQKIGPGLPVQPMPQKVAAN
ncbi:MAG: efflux RND transporter periplasmic adaptor subunit [Ancalomicrobiaceae bacterium]|nr:efflux RND transporter periplasmic adaptor subunit [Ancalomicrobiaceae bacterium]